MLQSKWKGSGPTQRGLACEDPCWLLLRLSPTPWDPPGSSPPPTQGKVVKFCGFRVFSKLVACFVDKIPFSQLIERTTQQISTIQFWKTQVQIFTMDKFWSYPTKMQFLLGPCQTQMCIYHTGCFFHWYPPKKLKYGKPRLGESTLT